MNNGTVFLIGYAGGTILGMIGLAIRAYWISK